MERGCRKAYVEGQIDKVRRMSRAEVLSYSSQPWFTKTFFCGNIPSPVARHHCAVDVK